jgi:hypothetical protein
MESDIPWKVVVDRQLFYNQVFHIYLWWEQVYSHMINRVCKMCVATVSLCMIVLIVTRKRGDGRYYFALWQTNNNTPNKMLLSESAVSCLLRARSVSFASWAKVCIKFVPHRCLVSLSHEVGVFLEEAICYFIYAKFAVMSLKVVHQYGCFESYQFRPRSVFFVSWRLKCLADDFLCLRYYCDNVNIS